VFVRQTPTVYLPIARRKIQWIASTAKVVAPSECISLATRKTPTEFNAIEEMEMTANDMMAEIRDANLSYLMLAQQMIRADKVTAIFRLGIAAEIAELIEGMSNAQILKLAGGNMMLARFRFDDSAILGMLTNYNKDRSLAQSHAAILMAGQGVEEIA
jgi:flagellar transcriptional activator FlhD